MNRTFFLLSAFIKWPTSLTMTVIASSHCPLSNAHTDMSWHSDFRYLPLKRRCPNGNVSIAQFAWKKEDDHCGNIHTHTQTIHNHFILSKDTEYENAQNNFNNNQILSSWKRWRTHCERKKKNKKNWFERVKRATHTTHNQNNTMLRKGFAVIKTEWSATCAFAFGGKQTYSTTHRILNEWMKWWIRISIRKNDENLRLYTLKMFWFWENLTNRRVWLSFKGWENKLDFLVSVFLRHRTMDINIDIYCWPFSAPL